MGVNGSKTVTNWTYTSANQTWDVYGSLTGLSTLNITGTYTQTTGTARFRNASSGTSFIALNINHLNLEGGAMQAGGSSYIISGFTATTANIGTGTLTFQTASGASVNIQSLNFSGPGVVALRPSPSDGGNTTLIVNTLTGVSGTIRVANSTATVASGTLIVSSGTYGGTLTDATASTVNSRLALIKDGSGLLALTGSNTYNGGTTINDGTLQIGTGGTGGSISGNVSGENSSAVLSFNRSNTYAYSGTISGSGQVAQVGAGTTTLTANNTYTGTTSISAGTLMLSTTGNNNIASSSTINIGASGTLDVSAVTGSGGFTLASGQTLTGVGTVEGAFTVGSGAVLAAGNSPGTLTFNDSLTLSAGSTSNFEINGLTSGLYDVAQGGAGLQLFTFDGTLNLIFQTGFAINGTVKIFAFDSYTGTFSAVNVSGLAAGYTASFNSLTGDVTVVPEPASYALLGLGLGIVLWRAGARRRRA